MNIGCCDEFPLKSDEIKVDKIEFYELVLSFTSRLRLM